MDYAVLIEKATELANRYGITATRVHHPPTYGYEENEIRFLGHTDQEAFSNLCHDLAHWLIASPDRRVLPDFGLGPGPDSCATAERNVNVSTAQLEESAASILGILIERHLGGDVTSTLKRHRWSNRALHIIDLMQTLTDQGLVRKTAASKSENTISFMLDFEPRLD